MLGLPNGCYEDIIYALCVSDQSPEHESRIRKMKISTAMVKMIIKEKEAFRIWRDAKKNED
ncbi:MAG: hypothetical protein ABI528_09370 [bacterium]